MDIAQRDRSRWNIAAILAYTILLALCFYLIDSRGGIVAMRGLDAFDISIIAIGAFRLMRLITFDKVFEFIRAYFDDGAPGEEKTPRRGFRRLIHELLDCIWCTGAWSAPIVLTAYLYSAAGAFVVFALAIAGVASLLQIVTHTIYEAGEK